jgi:hypothetical protein
MSVEYFATADNLSPLKPEEEMKRDMDLVRRIMLDVQSRNDLFPKLVRIDGIDNDLLARHVEMMFDEGLLTGTAIGNVLGIYRDILVTDLSWAGHDFIGAISKDGVWQKLKETFSPSEISTLPLSRTPPLRCLHLL